MSSQAFHRVYFDGVFFQVLQRNLMGGITKFVTLLGTTEWSMSQALSSNWLVYKVYL